MAHSHPVFMMRFDMRAPSTGAPATELYAAALEMAAWGETRGCVSAVAVRAPRLRRRLPPVPLMLASAMAARTTTLPIMVAVVILPLYDPVRLAEEMVVLDIISGGRVSYVAAIGYRPVEYEMYGVDFHRRGQIAEEKLEILLRAKTGEPFEHEGRRIHVTPPPVTPGGPMVVVGRRERRRRAARRSLRPRLPRPGRRPRPRGRVRRRRRGPPATTGLLHVPPPDAPTTMFVADDVDRAWDELGPYLMHDVTELRRVERGQRQHRQPVVRRRRPRSCGPRAAATRSSSVDEAIELARAGTPLGLHPLIGGLPPGDRLALPRDGHRRVMPALA